MASSQADAQMKAHPTGAKMRYNSDPLDWQKRLRHKTPILLEVGRTPPKCVLSFGGAGFLVTYALGVAMYLQKEKSKMLAESYIVGAGSGIIPAIALACGPQVCDIEKIRDRIVENTFPVWREDLRQKIMRQHCEELLPDNVHKLMSGRMCAGVSMSHKDAGFYRQQPHMQIFGAHIATFDSKADVTELVLAATAPNHNTPYLFRGQPCVRATCSSISTELDQFVRHIYIHGLSGNKSKHYTRHRVLVGRHGMLANCHLGPRRQMQLAAYPLGGREVLKKAFDDGYFDARRYERWEEDPYHYSKTDRSPGGDTDWRDVRAAIFGDKQEAGKL
jgi:hypothetical protein